MTVPLSRTKSPCTGQVICCTSRTCGSGCGVALAPAQKVSLEGQPDGTLPSVKSRRLTPSGLADLVCRMSSLLGFRIAGKQHDRAAKPYKKPLHRPGHLLHVSHMWFWMWCCTGSCAEGFLGRATRWNASQREVKTFNTVRVSRSCLSHV